MVEFCHQTPDHDSPATQSTSESHQQVCASWDERRKPGYAHPKPDRTLEVQWILLHMVSVIGGTHLI
jgi:hypothetical protein